MTEGLSTVEVAALLKCSKYTVSRIARGKAKLPLGVKAVKHLGGRGPHSKYMIIWEDAWKNAVEPIGKATGVQDREAPKDAKKPAPKNPKVEIEHSGDGLDVNIRGQSLIRNIDDLVRIAEIDLEKWECTSHKVNTWTTPMKIGVGEDMRPIVVRNWQVSARFERRWSRLVRPAQPIGALPMQKRRMVPAVRRAVIVPDTQHGFRWSPDRTSLDTIHDRAAIDAVIQLIRRLKPTDIILLGDMLDLAPWSIKYARDPMLCQTTQPSIDECHAMLASMRKAAPTARIEYHEGNHEHRIGRLLVDRADEALYLRAVGDDREVLSVPRLLALDELGIEYCGPYGEDTSWLWGKLRIQHGTKAKAKGGATAGVIVAETDYDTVFGHVHRCETASRTVESPQGPRIITAATPGCLCRVDGAVPGATSKPDWQQGVGVVTMVDEKIHNVVYPIHRGVLVYDGNVIRGEERGEEWADATGWEQSS